MLRLRYRWLPLPVALLIAAGSWACGGDDGGNASATPTSRRSSPTQPPGGATTGATAAQTSQPSTSAGVSAKVESALKDPCSLLTVQELSAAIGSSVEVKPDVSPAQATSIFRIAKCQWLSPTSPAYTISVELFVLNDAATAATLVNDITVEARDDKATVTKVQGIGEGAYVAVGDQSTIAHPARALAVAGKVAVRIEVGVGGTQKVSALALTTLTKAAAGRVF